ncbi:MAG: hypothetical protein KF886_06345 [Candidatus Hydrogenedentes bacterium]|nr:hypothetical protein [Candidatus Hydrogenedentota bacterium]
MWRGKQYLGGLAALVFVVSGAFFTGPGCGLIADTDRIVVAKIGDKSITRGDLFRLIYEMDDDERPIIRSRMDYRRVLDQYIDRQIKMPLGQQMAQEGKLNIDREMAREQFFKQSGDREQEYRHMWSVPVPKDGEETELMKVYNLRAADIQAMKNIIEQETDRLIEQMQGEAAVHTLAAEAFRNGEIELDPEALRLEYEINQEQLHTFEGMTFLGLQFPASDPESSAEASRVRERVNNGESFDAILEEYLARSMRYGIESDIENNPSLTRFQTFWDQASGAREGDILGPLYMPEYARAGQDASGQPVQQTVPATYLVFKVLEHRPARTLTLEEATPMLAAPIAYAAMMEKLRDERGVEVYEDKLPEVRGGERDIFGD